MAKKPLLVLVCVGLTLFSLIGCVSAPKEWSVALTPTLDESLRRYIGPSLQTWDSGDVTIYYLDPLHFEEFKAELDAAGEYLQSESRTYDRTWDRGKTFARWVARPDGRFELTLCKEDNATLTYRYIKIP